MHHEDDVTIRPATAADINSIRLMVESAYTKYVPRMEKLPAPMTADYNGMLQTHQVYVLCAQQIILGAVIFSTNRTVLDVDNIVVDPSAQGRGYGRTLVSFLEQKAKESGLEAIELYTNEKMYENIGMYTKLGFVEVARRNDNGFNRIYYRKEVH